MFKEMKFGRVDILWLEAISCVLRAKSGSDLTSLLFILAVWEDPPSRPAF
jgi:hypothetical protein